MPSISPSFVILGAVMASVIAQNRTMVPVTNNQSVSYINMTSNATNSMPNTTTPVAVTRSTMNMSMYTTGTGSGSSEGGSYNTTAQPTTMGPTTPKTTTSAASSTATKSIKATSTTLAPKPQSGSSATGIIIFIVIILVALCSGLACYLAKKRGRRYSVDFSSRPDEANIPLSTVEPEAPVGAASQNGLQTFESTDISTKEPQEPEEKVEVQEEQKAEADKSVDEASAEFAAPAPSADAPEDKPNEEVVEQSSAAPVEPSKEEKTDDEGVVSNKTSVESLKETNENNSNNADLTQNKARDLQISNFLWEVSLDSMV